MSIEKIRKLLALGQSSNANEAAAALAKAQGIADRLNIDLAKIGDGESDPILIEKVEAYKPTKKYTYWRVNLAAAAAITARCMFYLSGCTVIFVGSEGTRITALAMYQYLEQTLNKLVRGLERGQKQRFYSAFRTEFALTVRRKAENANPGYIENMKVRMSTAGASRESLDLSNPYAGSDIVRVVQKEALAVDEFLKSQGVNLTFTRSKSKTSSDLGRRAGKAAAEGVSLSKHIGTGRVLAGSK